MRMRKKKNLEAKLAVCDNLFILRTGDRNFLTASDEKEYLDFTEIFGNNNPIRLEIGCGKGQFICEIAKRFPDINFVAVEKAANVIVTACQLSKDLKNVIFINCAAEYLSKYIPPKSVELIYLNFSCPFPKNKYASHRLTSERFLPTYYNILTDNGEIHQKTDNMQLFEFSIEKYNSFGFKLKNVSLDLHNSNFEGNIVTEYENRFASQGFPIYRLEAYK